MRLLWRDRSAKGPDHELIWLAVSVIVLAGSAAWLAMALPWPKCPFLATTGLPCVTCGATRSAIAFLHLDFLLALTVESARLCRVLRVDRFRSLRRGGFGLPDAAPANSGLEGDRKKYGANRGDQFAPLELDLSARAPRSFLGDVAERGSCSRQMVEVTCTFGSSCAVRLRERAVSPPGYRGLCL